MSVACYEQTWLYRVREVLETALLRLQTEGGRSSIRVVAEVEWAQYDNNMILQGEDNMEKESKNRK